MRHIIIALVLSLTMIGTAFAQSSPNFAGASSGHWAPLTAAALNSAFQTKVDTTAGVLTNPTVNGAFMPNQVIYSKAKCDGTTDDAPEVQTEANSLTYGGRIMLPATGHACRFVEGVTIGNGSLSTIILEGVAGTYFPGFADNTETDWTARGTWIRCEDTTNACITLDGNGGGVKNVNFWHTQPTPNSTATCSSPCTMTHAWTPTTYPYTIAIAAPENFNFVEGVTDVNGTNGIDLEGPNTGVGGFFTYFEHVNLADFNIGMRIHQVDNKVVLHDVNFNPMWFQGSSDVLGYNEGDSTHTGHQVNMDIEYAADLMLDNVQFVQSMTAMYFADATVTEGLGNLTFAAQALQATNINFNQVCQAMAVASSTTHLSGAMSNVSLNVDPQTGSATQCGGYLPYAFNLASDNVDVRMTNLDALWVQTIAKIGGGNSGVLHIKNGRSTNFSAFNNGGAAFIVASGAALDADDLNAYLTTNGSAGPRVSGSASWPLETPGVNIVGASGAVKQFEFNVFSSTGGSSTSVWSLVSDAGNNFNLYRFNPSTGAFIDAPLTVNGTNGYVQAVDGLQLPPTKTFATLPTCNSTWKGVVETVSDASSPAWGAYVSGGGSSYAVVICDGSTGWHVH